MWQEYAYVFVISVLWTSLFFVSMWYFGRPFDEDQWRTMHGNGQLLFGIILAGLGVIGVFMIAAIHAFRYRLRDKWQLMGLLGSLIVPIGIPISSWSRTQLSLVTDVSIVVLNLIGLGGVVGWTLFSESKFFTSWTRFLFIFGVVCLVLIEALNILAGETWLDTQPLFIIKCFVIGFGIISMLVFYVLEKVSKFKRNGERDRKNAKPSEIEPINQHDHMVYT